MKQLIASKKAFQIVLDSISNSAIPSEKVKLEDSLGCVLQESVFADRDFPPFDRVTMDGIAISTIAYQSGNEEFEVQEMQPAGLQPSTLLKNTSCIEVMTGAVKPVGTDAVVRYEDIHLINGKAKILIPVKKGQNIHSKGQDRERGAELLSPGKRITAAEIAVLATVGKTKVLVSKYPKIAVVSTGDELVPVNQVPEPHQIRTSNSYMIQATLKDIGLIADLHHLPDDSSISKAKITTLLKHYEVLIFSGGVSMGKKDFIPLALAANQVDQKFHGVLQRPGKPLWFGCHEKAVVFALPGNPVSSFMCTHKYIIPWVRKKIGLPYKSGDFAILGSDFTFSPPLDYFLQVRIKINENGHQIAFPLEGKGSGDFANLLEADAFMALPAEKSTFKKGEVFPIFQFRKYE
jgi:molybdopterin molybdotransferase